MNRLWVVAAFALLSCKSKDDAPPSGTTTSLVATDPCTHPIPLTIGVATEGKLTPAGQCWAFDGIANVALVLDVEVTNEAPVEFSIVDQNAKDATVCSTKLDKKAAPWGKPHAFECMFPRTSRYDLRLGGSGAYRFKLRRRD